MQNTIQEYAWGSLTAISELLGRPAPSAVPEAELWMGAHPKAPSLIDCDGGATSLIELIERDPKGVLGEASVKKFGPHLPFLFKVLAAAKPLSIQAHPNQEQARQGFAAENKKKIPLDAADRNYKDENHKPECICALTPFWVMNGFRRVEDICANLSKYCPVSLRQSLKDLSQAPNSNGLKRFFAALMTLGAAKRQAVIDESIKSGQLLADTDEAFSWSLSFHRTYPGDIGILSPLFLNLICLEPGQALFIDAGEPHAYLNGMGIELMANSDNVLRGGLTSKHVDVNELVKVLDFKEKTPRVLVPRKKGEFEVVYETPAAEFELSVICMTAEAEYVSPLSRCAEIPLCSDGRAIITNTENNEARVLSKGTSVLVPAAVDRYRISGKSVLYKASVPV